MRNRRRILVLAAAMMLFTVFFAGAAVYAESTNAGQIINGMETNPAVESLTTTSYKYTTSIYQGLRRALVVLSAICLAIAFIRYAILSNAQKRDQAKDKIFVILIAVAVGAAAINLITLAFNLGKSTADAAMLDDPSSSGGTQEEEEESVLPADPEARNNVPDVIPGCLNTYAFDGGQVAVTLRA